MTHSNTLKLCKDCAHVKRENPGRFLCLRPAISRTNLLDGKIKQSLCYHERLEKLSDKSDRCGPEGKYFEQRQKKWYEKFLDRMY